MAIYDDLGNMVNESAAVVARDTSQQVSKLFDVLFAAGLTILEAHALVNYLQSGISTAANMSILLHQAKVAEGSRNVSVKVYGDYPACLDEECPLKHDCANHTTAGDYRTEDGDTPNLVKTDAGWQCNRHAEETRCGAVMVSGAYIGEHDECCQ